MDTSQLKEMETRMKKSLAALKEELSAVRTGRASAHLLDQVMAPAYGTLTPLNQLATINVPEARLITVQPWDRSTLKAIEKAIRDADLGLNPANDGQVIRVPIPELSEERRREMVKQVHKYGELGKVAVRNIRREGMDQLKKAEKDKDISQDELHQREKQVQELTDRYIKEMDAAIAHKEADVMQV